MRTILTLAVCFISSFAYSQTNFKPYYKGSNDSVINSYISMGLNDTLLNNEKTAVTVAEAILFNIYRQDSISGMDRKTSVSLIYKMLQGNWELVSDTNYKLSFKGRNAVSIYRNRYTKDNDTEKCRFVVLFYDTTYDSFMSSGKTGKYQHKDYEYPGRESDYDLITCDVDIPPSNSYFIFGCCVLQSIYSISKGYLRLGVGNSFKFKNGSQVYKRCK